MSVALALLLAGAALDPSGIFAPVGWVGHPVAALWWWAPYLVQVPLALLLSFVGARALLAEPYTGRSALLLRLWALVMLAMAAASFLASLLPVALMRLQGRYVLALDETLAFLLWSSGYAALKMLLVGWLPAVPAVWGRQRLRNLVIGSSAAARQAAWVSAACMLALAWLGPWLAQHFWQGGPMGYVYRMDLELFAPTPTGMPAGTHAGWSLALLGAVLYLGLRGGSSLSRACATAAWAAMVLLLVQALMLIHAHPAGAPHETWIAPALFVRTVDAGAFALVLAGLCVASNLACRVLPRKIMMTPVAMGMAALALGLNAYWSGYASHTAPPPAVLARPPLHLTPRGTDQGDMPRLQVLDTASGPRIADVSGTLVTLRGVNVNQLGEYFQSDTRLPPTRPLEEQDFVDMAALGLNMVRLTLSWSLLQPAPQQTSAAYIARIHQAVAWARAHGIYVLLDLHQDAWGVHVNAPPGTHCPPGSEPMTGWDGAPLWATLTDGTAPCQVTGRDLAPNVSRAFQSFYVDRDGIQSSLLQAWQILGREFGADPTVAGFDLLNEPNFGEQPPVASTLLLANYHARAIAALRAGEDAAPGGFRHLVMFEPSVIWSGFGIDNLPPRAFTSDAQIVFSPHLYNESITADQDFGLTLVSIERGYALAEAAARQMGVPLWIGEWGYFRAPAIDAPLLKRQVAAEDAHQLGSAFWVWKQGCSDPHVYPGKVAGNIRRMSCPGQEDLGAGTEITRILMRPYLRHHADASATWKADAGSFNLQGSLQGLGAGHEPVCANELWWPGDTRPTVQIGGALTLARMTRVDAGGATLGPSGGWLLRYCLTGGDYQLDLR
ncbi:MAG: cellulase family glycosylhydrolase [Burkholderiaceae bacterium]|nr:cellulase family glycosylhydrolase [Burkholderiaceae bacterium]